MAYDEDLANRIRAVADGAPNLAERRMFGGIAFMVNGKMACGIAKDALMVRIDPEGYAAALRRPEAREMTFTKRPMTGYVEVPAEALEDDELLADWVAQGIEFALTLPPK